MVVPSGKPSRIEVISFRAALTTSRVLAFDCLIIPKPTIFLPLPRNIFSSSSAAIATLATSPRYTSDLSSLRATTIVAKSFSVK